MPPTTRAPTRHLSGLTVIPADLGSGVRAPPTFSKRVHKRPPLHSSSVQRSTWNIDTQPRSSKKDLDSVVQDIIARLKHELNRRHILDFDFLRRGDVDGSDSLSLGELQKGMRSVGISMTSQEVATT